MEALGFQFFDNKKKRLTGNGSNLAKICSIRKPVVQEKIKFKIICDVDNPLLGVNGAAAVFGPQKGATPEMVNQLEKGLENWADVLSKETGNSLKSVAGGGAAGGLAIPLLSFFDAEMVEGTDFVLEQLKFEEQVKWADLVITGEGKIDAQTLNNKAPFGVAKMARKYKKPVLAIGGKVEMDASTVFDGVYSLVDGPVTLKYAMENSKELLEKFSVELAKTISVLIKMGEK